MKQALKYDVVVCGGGPAGIGAAIASARNGARTLLVEQYAYLGGCATFGMPLLNFHTQKMEKIIDGIPQEIVDEMVKINGITNHIPLKEGHISSYTLVDAEAMKYISQKMVLDAGADIFFHTHITEVLREKNRICGAVLGNKQGAQYVFANHLIDCTGDADVALKAGAVTLQGDQSGATQALTMNFRLGGVDFKKLTQWIDRDVAYAMKPGEDEIDFLRGWGTFGRWQSILDEMKIFKDKEHQIFVNSFRRGELNCNTIKVLDLDPTDPEELSKAEIAARNQVWQVFQFMKENCPGCEKAYILSTPTQIGIRETRRIKGDYELQTEDVLHGKKFPDVIARGAYTIDIHDPATGHISFRYVGGDGSYDIPYGCLIPQELEGLLVAGRCLSASHEAIGSARVMAICMAMGQAAGTAAALSLKNNCTERQLNIGVLQKTLLSQKVNLGKR